MLTLFNGWGKEPLSVLDLNVGLRPSKQHLPLSSPIPRPTPMPLLAQAACG